MGLEGRLAVMGIFKTILEAIFVRLALWRRLAKGFISMILRVTGNLRAANNPASMLLRGCIGIAV